MKRMIAVAAGLVGLAACQPASPPMPSRCDDSYQSLVGRNIGAVTLPDALPQRIISPGDLVTEDANPARLNVFVDPKGWIGRVTCG